jgi:hypothetical protein
MVAMLVRVLAELSAEGIGSAVFWHHLDLKGAKSFGLELGMREEIQ